MIVPILLLLQTLAGPAVLTVKGASGDVAVPLVETGDGPALRADVIAPLVGGSFRTLANGHYTLEFPGVAFDVTAQVPFARMEGDVLPLTTAPFVEDGALYIPLQIVAEMVPRYGTGVMYDADRGELRVFGGASRPRGVASRPPTALPGPASMPPRRAASTPARLRGRRMVVVDAGHGGPDNGMAGPIGSPRKIYEKDVTLAVARLVTEALRERGVEVAMTRTRDTLVALADRGRFANEKQADLFLSIHVNAANMHWADPAAARGFETYFLAEAKTEEESRVERMENEAVRFETHASAPKGDPLSFIINDMAQNEHLRESNDLASTIQGALRRMHPGPDRGVKQANFAVLRTSFMPAVLVEIGFGTNPAEASFLTDAHRQREIADAIANGTVEYLGHYERRVAGGDP
jgi:N-acetylmuramoyl-L-alanine amidase